ncbi:hypothetical protein JOD67_002281 [Tenggerimyces flavus]|nr:hypothetical protein [Tenggerimyces flavus]
MTNPSAAKRGGLGPGASTSNRPELTARTVEDGVSAGTRTHASIHHRQNE